jgi:hypothetical protein
MSKLTNSEDALISAIATLFSAFILMPWLGAWGLAACIEYYAPLIAHRPFEVHIFSRYFIPLMLGGFFLSRFTIPLALLGWLLTIFSVLPG